MSKMQDLSLTQLLNILKFDQKPRARTSAALAVSLQHGPTDWADAVEEQIKNETDDQAAAVMICVLDFLPPDLLHGRVIELLSSHISPLRRFHLYTIACKRRISLESALLDADLDGQDWRLRLAAARYCVKSNVRVQSAIEVLERLRTDLTDGNIEYADVTEFTGAPELRNRASLKRAISRLLFRAEARMK
jgi:hypothetical protein